MEQTNTFSNIPPKTFKRNEFGLLEGVNYVFNEDGSVNWRKMIKPEFLVPNKQRTQETDITKLQDNELLILLAGIKDLASMRGFSAVKHTPKTISESCVLDECTIEWTPNYENDDRYTSFSALADASVQNSTGFNGIYFLAAIAENRAFVRCVRNFLKINIVGQEEVSQKGDAYIPQATSGSDKSDPHSILEKVMDENNLSLDDLKERVGKSGTDVSSWNTLRDIPKGKVMALIEKIKGLSAKRKLVQS